jgi:hypothetical protein
LLYRAKTVYSENYEIFHNKNFFYSHCFLELNNNNKTGKKIKLVMVATNKVTDVSHPNANVPPKLLAQKMMKPAVNTSEVYMILNPVCCTVLFTVCCTSPLW